MARGKSARWSRIVADSLPDEIRAILRQIVHASIDTGATCQRAGSFTWAESGKPLRSAYDEMTDRAVEAMLTVWPAAVDRDLLQWSAAFRAASDLRDVRITALLRELQTEAEARKKGGA